MKIQTRILIFLIIVTISTVFSIVVLSGIILNNAFTKIENNLVIETANNMVHEIDGEINRLDKSAKDWAKWDETYNYIIGNNSKYIEENIMNGTFTNLEVNSISILNGYDIIYSATYDYTNDEPIELSPQGEQDIMYYIDSYKIARDNFNVKGLVMIDSKIVMIAAQDITTSDEKTVSNGSFIFSKYLDEDELKKSTLYMNKTFSIIETKESVSEKYPNATKLAPNIYRQEKYVGLDNDYSRNSNSLECIVQLRDIVGNPIGIIKVDINRNVYMTYQHAITLYILIFFMIVVLINITFFMTVKKTLLDKIKDVGDNITQIIVNDVPSKKISIIADKEIIDLTNNFNMLTQMLENQREELKKQNQELEKYNVELKKFDELKDNFLSNVSHEIRTPLTSLKSYTQSMLSGSFGKVSNEQRKSLKIILESEIELERIVNDLLDVSRFESGKMVIHYENRNINKIIRDSIQEFNMQLKNIKGKIRLSLDTKHNKISIDEGRIKQLLRNAISNSIKYRGERRLEIEIKTYKKDDYLVIEISDNGIGIEKSNMPHLFEKFYQVEQGMRRKSSGSGLGLVIIKQIAKSHNGKAFMESEYGKGATLHVYLKYHNKNKE